MIDFALVGCGRIGQRHAELMHKFGRLRAVCDTDLIRAKVTAEKFNATAYTSLHELIFAEKNIDVVAVCSPNGLHAAHSILALNAGSHVICEKPMAIHTADCTEMIAAAEKAKRKLFVVKQMRYSPPVMAVKKLLDANGLGKILSVQVNCFWHRPPAYYNDNWHGKKDLDGGTLFTQFSHFIDILYWYFGDLLHCNPTIANTNHAGLLEIDDQGLVTMELERAAMVGMHYTVNAFDQNMEGSITLFGEKGTIKIGGLFMDRISYVKTQNMESPVLQEIIRLFNNQEQTSHKSNHEQVYHNIIQVFQGESDMDINPVEAAKTVEWIERIYAAVLAP